MGQVIKLGAQGKKELAIAFKVTMAYVGQVLSGQKKGGKAPAIWEAAKKRNDSKSCTMLTKSSSMKQSKSSTTRVM